MVAWRRFVFALPLLALPLAGASVALASDAIELAQAQPQAQPTPAPSPTPSASPTPATDAQPAAVEPIGNVATVTGIATVVRDKNSYPLRVRDDIYLNDVVQTSSNSSLGITFNDATTFNLSASAKITIDNYVYEDGGKQNSAIFDIGKGTVAFVAAAVAKTGDMKIATPTATLGIRGTTGVVDVPEGAAASAANNVNIKLYPDADGRVGHIEVNDRTSGTRLGALTQAASGFAIRPGAGRHRRHALCRRADHDRSAADRARPRLRQPGASGADHGPADRHRAARLPPRQSDRNQPHSAADPATAAAAIAADDSARPAAAAAERPARPEQPSGSAAAGYAGPPGRAAAAAARTRRRRAAGHAARGPGSAAARPAAAGQQQPGQQQGAGQPAGAPRTGQGTQPGGALQTQPQRNGQTPAQPGGVVPSQPGTTPQPQTPRTGLQPGQPPAAQQPGGVQRQGGFQQRLPAAQRPAAPRRPAPAPKEKKERR